MAKTSGAGKTTIADLDVGFTPDISKIKEALKGIEDKKYGLHFDIKNPKGFQKQLDSIVSKFQKDIAKSFSSINIGKTGNLFSSVNTQLKTTQTLLKDVQASMKGISSDKMPDVFGDLSNQAKNAKNLSKEVKAAFKSFASYRDALLTAKDTKQIANLQKRLYATGEYISQNAGFSKSGRSAFRSLYVDNGVKGRYSQRASRAFNDLEARIGRGGVLNAADINGLRSRYKSSNSLIGTTVLSRKEANAIQREFSAKASSGYTYNRKTNRYDMTDPVLAQMSQQREGYAEMQRTVTEGLRGVESSIKTGYDGVSKALQAGNKKMQSAQTQTTWAKDFKTLSKQSQSFFDKVGFDPQNGGSLGFKYSNMANTSVYSDAIKELQQYNTMLGQPIKNQGQYDALAKQFDKVRLAIRKLNEEQKKFNAANSRQNQIDSLRQKLEGFREAAEKAGKTQQLNDLIAKLDGASNDASVDVKKLKGEVDGLTQSLSSGTPAAASFGEVFKNMFGISVANMVRQTFKRIAKDVYNNVKEINKALTEFQIVAGASEHKLESFTNNAFKTSQKISASFTDVVDAATVFRRLGYSVDDSLQMSEMTTMFSRLGDINVSDAEDAATAVLKAFNMTASDLQLAMDKMVKVGNNFPISASQIGTALNNASSALAAGGNNFDQSIALLTAANTTVQDASKASTALRTITARIRNTKTELEDLGEEVDENVNTTAKYRKELKALSGVDILDANNSFRSTYDILEELSKVWNTLGSKEKSAITTMVAGIRGLNVFESLMSNFDVAKEVMKSVDDSAGFMEDKYQTYTDSIEAANTRLKNSWQELSTDILNSDAVIAAVNLLNAGIQALHNTVETSDKQSFWDKMKPYLIGGGMYSGIKDLINLPKYVSDISADIDHSMHPTHLFDDKLVDINEVDTELKELGEQLADTQKRISDLQKSQTDNGFSQTIDDQISRLKMENVELTSQISLLQQRRDKMAADIAPYAFRAIESFDFQYVSIAEQPKMVNGVMQYSQSQSGDLNSAINSNIKTMDNAQTEIDLLNEAINSNKITFDDYTQKMVIWMRIQEEAAQDLASIMSQLDKSMPFLTDLQKARAQSSYDTASAAMNRANQTFNANYDAYAKEQIKHDIVQSVRDVVKRPVKEDVVESAKEAVTESVQESIEQERTVSGGSSLQTATTKPLNSMKVLPLKQMAAFAGAAGLVSQEQTEEKAASVLSEAEQARLAKLEEYYEPTTSTAKGYKPNTNIGALQEEYYKDANIIASEAFQSAFNEWAITNLGHTTTDTKMRDIFLHQYKQSQDNQGSTTSTTRTTQGTSELDASKEYADWIAHQLAPDAIIDSGIVGQKMEVLQILASDSQGNFNQNYTGDGIPVGYRNAGEYMLALQGEYDRLIRLSKIGEEVKNATSSEEIDAILTSAGVNTDLLPPRNSNSSQDIMSLGDLRRSEYASKDIYDDYYIPELEKYLDSLSAEDLTLAIHWEYKTDSGKSLKEDLEQYLTEAKSVAKKEKIEVDMQGLSDQLNTITQRAEALNNALSGQASRGYLTGNDITALGEDFSGAYEYAYGRLSLNEEKAIEIQRAKYQEMYQKASVAQLVNAQQRADVEREIDELSKSQLEHADDLIAARKNDLKTLEAQSLQIQAIMDQAAEQATDRAAFNRAMGTANGSANVEGMRSNLISTFENARKYGMVGVDEFEAGLDYVFGAGNHGSSIRDATKAEQLVKAYSADNGRGRKAVLDRLFRDKGNGPLISKTKEGGYQINEDVSVQKMADQLGIGKEYMYDLLRMMTDYGDKFDFSDEYVDDFVKNADTIEEKYAAIASAKQAGQDSQDVVDQIKRNAKEQKASVEELAAAYAYESDQIQKSSASDAEKAQQISSLQDSYKTLFEGIGDTGEVQSFEDFLGLADFDLSALNLEADAVIKVSTDPADPSSLVPGNSSSVHTIFVRRVYQGGNANDAADWQGPSIDKYDNPDRWYTGSANIAGTAYVGGKWGSHFGTHEALVGELGQEIMVDPHTGTWRTVGDHGPEIITVPDDAIIFNDQQTKGILAGRGIYGRGTQSHYAGTAHISGGGDLFTLWETTKKKNNNSSSSSKGKDDDILGDEYEKDAEMLEHQIKLLSDMLNLYHEGSEEWFDQQSNIITTYSQAVELAQREYERLIKAGYDASHKDMRKLAEQIIDWQNEIFDAQQNYWDAQRDNATKTLEHLDNHIKAIVDLKEAHYDLINSLEDEGIALQKEMQIARDAYPYLTEAERMASMTDEDYAYLLDKLSRISKEAGGMYEDYLKQIEEVGEDASYELDRITEQMQIQYDLKSKEYATAKAELAVLKARKNLENVMEEKSVATLVGGMWVWTADSDEVKAAMEELADAEQEYAKAQRDEVQGADIATFENYSAEVQAQIDAIDEAIFSMDTLAQEVHELKDVIWAQILASLSTTGKSAVEDYDTYPQTFADSAAEALAKLIAENDFSATLMSAYKSNLGRNWDAAQAAASSTSSSSSSTDNSTTVYIGDVRLDQDTSSVIIQALRQANVLYQV